MGQLKRLLLYADLTRHRVPWLPVAATVVVIVTSLFLWRVLAARESDHVQRMMEFKAVNIKDRFAMYMDARIRELDRLARRIGP